MDICCLTWLVLAVLNKRTSSQGYVHSVVHIFIYKQSKPPDIYAKAYELIHEYEHKLNEVNLELSEYKESVTLYQLQFCHENFSDTKYCIDIAEYKWLLSRKEDIKATLVFLKRRVQRQFPRSAYVESEAIVNDMTGGDVNLKTLENLQDVNGADIDFKDSGSSTLLDHGIRETLNIDDFFRRPIEIASFNISIGEQIINSYKVWDLYSLIPAVRAKLKNYAFFRGDLHLRVIITGSPFHYGRILASYEPYAPYNKNLTNYATIMASGLGGNAFNNYLNYLSQAPGAVSMDVKNNRPHEITCPFISPKNCHRLYNASTAAISAVTSFDDFVNAGSLYLAGLQPLQTVSTVSSSVCIQIYAWVENIELGCATATQTAITTESRDYVSDNDLDLIFDYDGPIDIFSYDSIEEFDSSFPRCFTESGVLDERKVGPVERVSSALARYSSYFSTIPAIAPLAMASTTLFNGLSGIASWFGWSRPTMDTEPMFVKNQPFMNASHTIGSETVQKITLDPRQGLTVDPRIVGIEHDELAINNLSKIESYLTQFQWNPLVSLMQSPIWTCAITPQLCTLYSGATSNCVQPTAMAFTAAPFDYWHGTIKFRFEVVRSEFHRGKLAFIFEPNIQQGVIISNSFSLNKNFMYIMDIQETESIELYFDWAQPRSWLKTLPANGIANLYSTSDHIDFTLSQFTNGVLFVTPFTNLTSPITSSILVNVYVSCEDLRVNQIDHVNLPISRLVVTNSADYHSHAFDMDVKSFHIVKSNFDDTGMCQHYFGESPVSFRALLKRYTTSSVIGCGTQSGASAQSIVCTFDNLPMSNPAYGATFTPTYYNLSLWHYLPYAFLGVRGSVRKRIHTVVNSSANIMGPQQRSTVSIGPISSSLTQTGVWAVDYSDLQQIGSVPFVPTTNGGIEVEIPFYSPNLFGFSFTNDLGISEVRTDEMITSWSTQSVFTSEFQGALGQSANVNIDSAVGDDFTFLRFCGAPFYSYATG